MNRDKLASVVRSWAERSRVAAVALRAQSPIVHGILVTLFSTLCVYLSSKLLNPLVFYAYWRAICWPVDGLMIGVLLLCSRKDWPWIMLGYVIASVPGELLSGTSGLMVFMDMVCNLFEIGFAAFCLPACTGLSEWLRRPRLILRFSVLALVVGPLTTAIVWATFTLYYSHWQFWDVVERWVSGDALGIALFTPLVLVLFSRETYQLIRPGQGIKTLTMFLLLFGVSWSVFHQNVSPVAFLIFPVLVIIVNRIGFSGAVLAVNLLTFVAAKATIQGTGPFMFVQGHYEPYRIMTLQVYLTVAMVMSFAITLTALERNNLQEQLKLALQQMEVLATHDGLTGLGNRRLFDLTLDTEWGRAKREGRSIGLLMLDADNFKAYNDMYGHVAGDECLRAIAHSLAPQLKRAGDLAARYGGEEFVVLLPGATLDQTSQVAESIRKAVEDLDIEHKGTRCQHVTISVGSSAMVPGEHVPSQRLIEDADGALYAAKQGGRNRVVSGRPKLAPLAPTGTG